MDYLRQNQIRRRGMICSLKGNPAAAQYPDNSGALPLHIACQHNDSASVVQYLLGLDEQASLDAVDRERNTALLVHAVVLGMIP